MSYCTVCKKEYASNFCPNCGQKKTNAKITFVTLIGDFFNNIFALDKSLYSDVKCLLLNPSLIINGYLDGYRKYYSSPGKLFVLAAILMSFGLYFTEGHFFILHLNFKNFGIQEQFLFILIFIVLFSSSSYLTYYLKWKKNFVKHIIVNIYNISSWVFLFTPLSIVDYLYIQHYTTSKFFLFSYFFLIIIWNNRTFKINPTWKRIPYIGLNIILLGLIIFIIISLLK